MVKVLIFSEDYSESTKLQTELKKVGFDVSLSNTATRVSDLILTLNPDVVLAMAVQKSSSLSIVQKLKELNFFKGKAIAVVAHGERPQPAELVKARADLLMESPIGSRRLIEIIAKLMQIEVGPLLEKLNRTAQTTSESNRDRLGSSAAGAGRGSQIEKETVQFVRGSKPEAEEQHAPPVSLQVSLNDPERASRYNKLAATVKIDKAQSSHARQEIKMRQAELRKDWDSEVMKDLDKLRREFVAALFKKE